MKKEIICIGCPMGCYLTVDYVGTKTQSVSGNRCKVGQDYAQKEISNPERTLTTTVKVKNGLLPLVSIRTNKPIPKSKLLDTMNELASVEVEAPIRIGDIIVKDILGMGADVVASKNVSKRKS